MSMIPASSNKRVPRPAVVFRPPHNARGFPACAALVLAAELCAADIPLTVVEPAGVARRGEVVTSGVCLPRGAYRAEQSFRLFDGGLEVPLQTAPLVVERDGSLRWVLLDFPLDLDARGRKTLVLRPGTSAARPAAPVEVRETEGVIRVDTGPLRFDVSRIRPFSVFDAVKLRDGDERRGAAAADVVEARSGRRFRAAAPSRVEWEYRGPLRVTLRVEGRYEPADGTAAGADSPRLGYITRLTAWAGRTDVLVQHILANSNPDQVSHVNLRAATLSFPGPGGGGATARTGHGGVPAAVSAERPAWLHRGAVGAAPGAVRAGSGNDVAWTGATSGGWILAESGGRSVWVCDRDFEDDPPRRLRTDGRTVTVDYVAGKTGGGRGEPFRSENLWLFDLSHRMAEIRVDFAPVKDPDAAALAARSRLRAFAPPEWYAECDVFGTGRFGTLDDEKKAYRAWGWAFEERQVPRAPAAPGAFVRWEDNHYESEADSAEALLLMAVRTGERGFLDQGEAWARYHANLHAWRTDGWAYDDGAIWFPQGGPQGTKPSRRPSNVPFQKWDKGSGDDRELWHLAQGKACYCHFYGAGLVDWFLLTGERDMLEAAVDLAEQKDSEFRKHRRFTPGVTTIDDTRGFGRGFYVLTHLLEARPADTNLEALVRLCRDVLWRDPNLDERGFAPCHIGTGFGGFDPKKHIPPAMKAFMETNGISIDAAGVLSDRSGRRWPVVCLGGTWQHAYVQAAADRYATRFDDEDLADFSEAFGRFAARHLMSRQCRQVPYYAFVDVPVRGEAWDPWRFEPAHTATTNGAGCEHDGYYTRFFPDAIAIAYRRAGGPALLERAREFWHYGSKRGYHTTQYTAGWDAVGAFAGHRPPKDDTVLSASRLFYEWAHPRSDTEPPERIGDLAVAPAGGGRFRVTFTAPADRGGGRVARYRVKCADRPIVDYDEFDFARDDGVRRNFWRAVNLAGEPAPSHPGRREDFTVTGLPAGAPLYVVVAACDDSGNRGPCSAAVLVSGVGREGKP